MSVLRVAGRTPAARRAFARALADERAKHAAIVAETAPEVTDIQRYVELARLDHGRALAELRARVRLAELDAERAARAERRWHYAMTQLHAAVEKGEITPEDAREILEDRSDEDLKEEVLSLLKST
jgi:hypothetical protein